MPLDTSIKKVLVIGSGPIVIGQAAEFDYAGAQACLSLREEGIRVILLNSNPATIMTDRDTANAIYIEPMNLEVIEQILDRERPDGILPTLGGQTGLNLSKQIAEAGLLDPYQTKLLGTPLSTIHKAEDREAFRQLMLKIGEPVPPSEIAHSVSQTEPISKAIGFPLIIRPAYTLGGSGGGIAHNLDECRTIAARGLEASPIRQILVEKYIGGWKEIEYEVIRDKHDNCITICNMENLDPMGIHTGDSIVVAPSQTLSNPDYQMLRTSSINIIRALGVEGGCNIQFGLDPSSQKYYVIEVNPRVSRSSALASKATGYPIARVAAKIAVGLTLDEIPNAITQKTVAAFEPALDYVVVKIPRFPFDKFPEGNRLLGTQMKATGEVMALGRTFEEALQKAIRSLDTIPEIDRFISQNDYWVPPTDLRLFLIFHAIRRGISVEEIHRKTSIDRWFLQKIRSIVQMESTLRSAQGSPDRLSSHLHPAKQMGFTDQKISQLTDLPIGAITDLRIQNEITPTYKMVDTCAAEFEAQTPYFFSTWEQENEATASPRMAGAKKSSPKKAIVLGSGPIRIGQGIEFDYGCVHAAKTLRSMNIRTIMINNNPETVSTDFDVSDRLYFEPLTAEDVAHVFHNERNGSQDMKDTHPDFLVQFGGQTSLNLALDLNLSGLFPHTGLIHRIKRASDRRQFEQLLRKLDIPYPAGRTASSPVEAIAIASEIGFPLLVRPSFVLGGRAMEIIHTEEHLAEFIQYVFQVSPHAPVLVDRYLEGKEVEVDLLFDGHDVLIPGIMEHIERAGIHSGDSMAVYPTQSLTLEQIDTIADYSTRLARELGNRGLSNIQYVLFDQQVYVIELNPRSSRTVPFLSKVTNIPMIELAVKLIYGARLSELGYTGGLLPPRDLVAVKAPVFSFAKLENVSTKLGPEMKSTGEVMGIDTNFPDALHKAFLAAGISVPRTGTILATIADQDKKSALNIIRGFHQLGFGILATQGTTDFLGQQGMPVKCVQKISDNHSDQIPDLLRSKQIDLVINTPSASQHSGTDGPLIRQTAIQFGIPCLTSLDTARALLYSLRNRKYGKLLKIRSMEEYLHIEKPNP